MGGACPSGCYHVGTARSSSLAHYRDRQASAGYGPASDNSATAQPSEGSTKACHGGLLAIRAPGDAVQLPGVETVERCQRSWRYGPRLAAVHQDTSSKRSLHRGTASVTAVAVVAS